MDKIIKNNFKYFFLYFDLGWVSLIDLTKVPMMKWYNMYDLMKEVINSKSHRGTNRYEQKHENGIVYIRALYGRRMERVCNFEKRNKYQYCKTVFISQTFY